MRLTAPKTVAVIAVFVIAIPLCALAELQVGKKYVVKDSVDLRSSPGVQRKKKINEKATRILKTTHYLRPTVGSGRQSQARAVHGHCRDQRDPGARRRVPDALFGCTWPLLRSFWIPGDGLLATGGRTRPGLCMAIVAIDQVRAPGGWCQASGRLYLAVAVIVEPGRREGAYLQVSTVALAPSQYSIPYAAASSWNTQPLSQMQSLQLASW